MKIGILGTRGIPNHYGGFEQFAEYLSVGLVKRGHEVVVYNSSSHPFQEKKYEGVDIVHCYDPESKIGTAGQFVYDLNCILDARKRSFDVLLQLGYTSSSVWGPLLPKKPVVFTNMDGLEWKRSKYSNRVKKFLHHAEKWAVKSSDVLIADSQAIQTYLQEKFGKPSEFIAYGAEIFDHPDKQHLVPYNVNPFEYFLLIARMEPENNIEMILQGYQESGDNRPFLVVGKTDTAFGKKMEERFSTNRNIRFVGGIYNSVAIDNLRYYSRLYFHGHTVGGTNPSLLEAMGAGAVIAAHDNPFNKAVLESQALFFDSADGVAEIIRNVKDRSEYSAMIDINRQKIRSEYNWNYIIDQYEKVFVTHQNRLRS